MTQKTSAATRDQAGVMLKGKWYTQTELNGWLIQREALNYMMQRTIILFVAVIAFAAVAAVSIKTFWASPAAGVYIASEAEEFPADKNVEVRYIANEGVLISTRDKRVLIDGLHRRYGPAYAYLPDAEREKIETAKTPFDKIDLILVSHMHGDHFHPESVGRYLESSPKTILATSEQVAGEIAAKFADYQAIKDRITPIAYVFKERATKNLAGIEVEILSIGHGGGRHASIQNLGHIFSLGGKKFLHLGDAVPSIETFDHFNLETEAVDIAFIPSWFLTSDEGRTIIREHIKPKHIIAVHVGPAEAASLSKAIAAEFPTADVFGTMLEKRRF